MLQVTMAGDIHLDEKHGLPEFNDLKLNFILRQTGAYEGNSTVSVQLLLIQMRANDGL